jgi:integrase
MEAIEKCGAWNKGKLVGQKPPLKPKDIWAIRIHLQNANAARDLAMFNLAIDSKLRGCDLVSLRLCDIALGNRILARAYGDPEKNAAVGAVRADGADENGCCARRQLS